MSIQSRSFTILQVEDTPSDTAITARAPKAGDIPNWIHVVTDGEQALAFLTRRAGFADGVVIGGVSICQDIVRAGFPPFHSGVLHVLMIDAELACQTRHAGGISSSVSGHIQKVARGSKGDCRFSFCQAATPAGLVTFVVF